MQLYTDARLNTNSETSDFIVYYNFKNINNTIVQYAITNQQRVDNIEQRYSSCVVLYK